MNDNNNNNPPPGDPFDPATYRSQEAPASAIMAGQEDGSKNVKLLVFDMGHVFVDFDWNAVCEGFCRISGRTREQLKEDFRYVASLGYERGEISTADFLCALNGRLETSLTVEQFTELWNVTFQENAEMAELLAVLKEQRPLYLLSNTNEVHFDFLESSFTVTRHFSEVILSYKVRSSKPDRQIYEEVLKRSGLSAAECLFVDDLAVNIAAARDQVGMQVIHFKGVTHLKERLRELGFQTERAAK